MSAPEGVDPVPLDEIEAATERARLDMRAEIVAALAAVRELVDLGGNDGP